MPARDGGTNLARKMLSHINENEKNASDLIEGMSESSDDFVEY